MDFDQGRVLKRPGGPLEFCAWFSYESTNRQQEAKIAATNALIGDFSVVTDYTESDGDESSLTAAACLERDTSN
jgi:hypothetical protein